MGSLTFTAKFKNVNKQNQPHTQRNQKKKNLHPNTKNPGMKEKP
jgi:hypothetical protein